MRRDHDMLAVGAWPKTVASPRGLHLSRLNARSLRALLGCTRRGSNTFPDGGPGCANHTSSVLRRRASGAGAQLLFWNALGTSCAHVPKAGSACVLRRLRRLVGLMAL